MFFAFTNQAQLLPIFAELNNPVKRRGMTMITRSTVIVIFFYMMMALFGYLSTLGDTPEIVIVRKSILKPVDYF